MSREGPGSGKGRVERLEAALRENLRRRKAQARGRAAAHGEPNPAGADDPAATAPHGRADAGGKLEVGREKG